MIEDPHGSSETELHILERINMSFSVQNAILDVPNLTRFKIAGDLPELQVNFSDKKYSKWVSFVAAKDRNVDALHRCRNTQI